MGREVRMVPSDWEHPKQNGSYIPLYGGLHSTRVQEWDREAEMWKNGKCKNWVNGEWVDIDAENVNLPFEEWSGKRPQKEDYMPEWSPGECTYLMMYETCTEGTPISPAFETPEELARWPVDNDASPFADMTATYEQWFATCKDGCAPSAVYSPNTGLISGVAAMEKMQT